MLEHFEQAKKLKMPKVEFDRVRANLVACIEEEALAVRDGKQSGLMYGSTSSFIRQKKNKRMPIAIGIILSLLLGSGVAYAAEQSLPGDPLYPVKVSVNENVRGAFAFSPEARAQWETHRLERRFDETERLALHSEFKKKRFIIAGANFENHTERMKKMIERMRQNGESESAAEIEARMSEMVALHAELQAAISDEDKEAIKQKLSTFHENKILFHGSGRGGKTVVKIAPGLDQMIASAKKNYEKKMDTIGAESQIQIEMHLKKAVELSAEAAAAVGSDQKRSHELSAQARAEVQAALRLMAGERGEKNGKVFGTGEKRQMPFPGLELDVQ